MVVSMSGFSSVWADARWVSTTLGGAGGVTAADMKLVAASAGTDKREISKGSQSVAVNSLRSWPFGVVSTFL